MKKKQVTKKNRKKQEVIPLFGHKKKAPRNLSAWKVRLKLLRGLHQVNGLASQFIGQADYRSRGCFVDIISALFI